MSEIQNMIEVLSTSGAPETPFTKTDIIGLLRVVKADIDAISTVPAVPKNCFNCRYTKKRMDSFPCIECKMCNQWEPER